MKAVKALALLQQQEQLLVFPHFSYEDSIALGELMTKRALEKKLAGALSIRLNSGYTVYQCALPGSVLNNQFWMARKQNIVRFSGISSLQATVTFAQKGETLAKHGLNDTDYVLCGGGFPITVAGTGLVGCAAFSGLPDVMDHDFIVSCIAEFLGVNDVPHIDSVEY